MTLNEILHDDVRVVVLLAFLLFVLFLVSLHRRSP